jgi:hypothetical protein
MNAPAGLIRDDMAPKPAYTELLALIHNKWWTNTQTRTNPKGTAESRVFYGAYTLTATDKKGKTTSKTIFFPEAAPDLTVTLHLP